MDGYYYWKVLKGVLWLLREVMVLLFFCIPLALIVYAILEVAFFLRDIFPKHKT